MAQTPEESSESRAPAVVALLAVMGLQFVLQRMVSLSPFPYLQYALIALEALLLFFLWIANGGRAKEPKPRELWFTRVLLSLIALDNLASAFLLCKYIVERRDLDVINDPGVLLGTGAAIFVTNIIIFGIWYWENDGGGPYWRTQPPRDPPDSRYFMFTQEANRQTVDIAYEWSARFLDYLYVSFTNVVAFSPTDTMPLTRSAKTLMALQSIISVSTLVLVFARAVNVLDPVSC